MCIRDRANDQDFTQNQQLVLDNKALFMPNGTWIVGEMAEAPRADGFESVSYTHLDVYKRQVAARRETTGSVRTMVQLMPMKIDQVGAASVRSNVTRFEMADDAQVYLWYKGQYYATKLTEVNSEEMCIRDSFCRFLHDPPAGGEL